MGASLLSGNPQSSNFIAISTEFDDKPALGQLIGSWTWPSHSRQIIRSFIVPARITDTKHRGLDIAAPAASLLHSPANGTVRFTGLVVNRWVLTIDHGMGVVSTFDPIVSELSVGDRVTARQVIGSVAAEDHNQHCAISCYHLGARLNGKYINPLLLLGELPRSVLYPLPSPTLVN